MNVRLVAIADCKSVNILAAAAVREKFDAYVKAFEFPEDCTLEGIRTDVLERRGSVNDADMSRLVVRFTK